LYKEKKNPRISFRAERKKGKKKKSKPHEGKEKKKKRGPTVFYINSRKEEKGIKGGPRPEYHKGKKNVLKMRDRGRTTKKKTKIAIKWEKGAIEPVTTSQRARKRKKETFPKVHANTSQCERKKRFFSLRGHKGGGGERKPKNIHFLPKK